MRKLIIYVTALTLVTGSFTSCSNVKNTADSSAVSNETATNVSATEEHGDEKQHTYSGLYKCEIIDSAQNLGYIETPFKLNDTTFTINSSDETGSRVFLTDSDFKDFALQEFRYPDEALEYDACFGSPIYNSDGSFNMIVVAEDHHGMVMPKEYDESFDYDSYWTDCEYICYACSYLETGELASCSKINYTDEYKDAEGRLCVMQPIADGEFIYAVTYYEQFPCIVRINCATGEMEKIYMSENYYELSLVRDRDDKIIIGIPVVEDGNQYGDYNYNYYELNDSDEYTEPFYVMKPSDSMYIPNKGYDEFRLIISKYDGLFGIRDDGSEMLIIDWMNSSISCMDVCAVGNDEFVGTIDEQNGDNYTKRLVKLTPRDVSELDSVKIITLGCPYDGWIDKELINRFNNSQETYRINVQFFTDIDWSEDFSKQEAEAQKGLEKLFLTGEEPGIVFGLDYGGYFNLMKKGAFTDLGELMDSSSEYGRDAFVSNALNAFTYTDGGIYALPTRFRVDSKLVKDKIWDKPTWTLDEMISVYDNSESFAEHLYDDYTKEEMLHIMVTTFEELIDFDKAKCNFESPEFIKALEFCNRFPNEIDKPSKADDGDEAVQSYYTDKFYWFGNDEVITLDNSPGGVNYCMTKYLQGNGEDMHYVGFPSSNGSGGKIETKNFFSITSSCEEKQGAWEFITFILKYQAKSEDGYDVLSEKFKNEIYGEVGEQHSASGNVFPPLTKEEADMIYDYILSCNSVSNSLDYDLWDIIIEESNGYFAGELTAKQTAERIQSRAEILLSEKQ